MTKLKVIAMPTETARAYQAGSLDANGQPPEREISDGLGNPCRHCLSNIDKGEEKLVLSFVHSGNCSPMQRLGQFSCTVRSASD